MSWVFCDTTVLCNFAAIGRIDLLTTILRGRGRWTEAVAFEARRSRGYLSDLARLVDSDCFGEPIEAARTDAEALQIERVRRAAFGGGADKPTQHLGESETIFVIGHHVEFAGSWWVSDDREAVRYGRQRGVLTRETMNLMSDAVAMADLTADEAYALLLRMDDAQRTVRLPANARELAA